MDIPAKSDYAVRAMLALADLTADHPDSLATVEQLADQQGLPRKFLEAILRDLRRAGLVRTRRGSHGGYSLASAPSEITIGMILRAVDGPLAEVRGLRPHETSYLGAAAHLPTVWVAVRSALREVLDTTTLEQVRTGRLSARVRRLAELRTRGRAVDVPGEPVTSSPQSWTPWLDVFVDVPERRAAGFRAFWSAVTGWPESAPRGDRGQFRSLLPPDGRAYLRIQELDEGPRIHVDLISHDLTGDAARLEALGAGRVLTLDGVEILRSPGGQVLCLVRDDEPRPDVPREFWPSVWPGGQRSRLTHVCIDVPPAGYDAEVAFWAEATGWAASPTSRPEFTFVTPPGGTVPLRLLIQRLDDPADEQGAHLDLGTDDIPAEVARLIALGARDGGAVATWHVLRDPVVGLPFCVTDQAPD